MRLISHSVLATKMGQVPAESYIHQVYEDWKPRLQSADKDKSEYHSWQISHRICDVTDHVVASPGLLPPFFTYCKPSKTGFWAPDKAWELCSQRTAVWCTVSAPTVEISIQDLDHGHNCDNIYTANASDQTTENMRGHYLESPLSFTCFLID